MRFQITIACIANIVQAFLQAGSDQLRGRDAPGNFKKLLRRGHRQGQMTAGRPSWCYAYNI
jgi:hypothetical protein